jgi:outer membrane protein assembly factor BamB
MRTTLAILILATAARAQDWPQFRGPTGQGHTTEKNLPVTWSPETVRWKAPLVGEGHASPIVTGERVLITTVRWPGGRQDPKVMPEHHVLCHALADGKLLWDTQVEPGPWRREDFRSGAGGGYAAPTPATDGKRVFAVFSSSVIAALDLDGKLAWRQEIKPFTFDVTIGTSPVLFGETVLLHCAMAKPDDSRLVAFSKADGSVKWETKLAGVKFGHSTPGLIEVKGKPQLVTLASGMGAAPNGIQAFDPADGRRLWWCKAQGDASSFAWGGGLLYSDSGRGGGGTAVDPSGEGDVTATHIKWTTTGLTEAIASPIVVGEHVFRLQSPGVLRIWKLSTGEETDRQRLDRIGTTWASPIADGEGRIFFASGGRSYVVKAGPKVEILATNDLGDPNHSSPAVAGGRLIISGLKNLYVLTK